MPRDVQEFQRWMQRVDAEMLDIAQVESDDIADFDYASAFECGQSSEKTAVEALEADDFPGE
jgi:hypothetical protein